MGCLPKEIVILSGIVGSHAYGLNNEQSDIDKIGVFVYPTHYFWSLDKLPETKVTTKPDSCYHEIEKFLRLCLNCNPTVMELLWLPPELLDRPDINSENPNNTWAYFSSVDLINLRKRFLSSKRVSEAYGGYAYSQMKKIRTSDSHKKFKHTMHCFRLLRQGKELLASGHLTIRVSNPEEYKQFELMSVDQIEELFNREYAEFQAIRSVLPEHPDKDHINNYLARIRNEMLIYEF